MTGKKIKMSTGSISSDYELLAEIKETIAEIDEVLQEDD